VNLLKQLNEAAELLLEYDHDITLQKFGPALVDKAKKDPTAKKLVKNPTAILQNIEAGDPTPHKEYTQWLVRLYINNPIRLEDVKSTMGDTLEKFNKLKIKKVLPGELRDINRVKSPEQLHHIIQQYADKLADAEPEDKGKAEMVFQNENVRLIRLLNREAAEYYGRGTRWCTAARNNNMFDYYFKSGPLYVVLPKKPQFATEKYQMHPATGQCKDHEDNTYKFYKVLDRFPELIPVFRALPDFADIEILHTDPAQRAERLAKKKEAEAKRDADIDDFLKSLTG